MGPGHAYYTVGPQEAVAPRVQRTEASIGRIWRGRRARPGGQAALCILPGDPPAGPIRRARTTSKIYTRRGLQRSGNRRPAQPAKQIGRREAALIGQNKSAPLASLCIRESGAETRAYITETGRRARQAPATPVILGTRAKRAEEAAFGKRPEHARLSRVAPDKEPRARAAPRRPGGCRRACRTRGGQPAYLRIPPR